MIEAFIQLKPVQFIGIFVLIVGIMLIVLNKIEDSASSGVTFEFFNIKINTPRSTIIFLAGIVIMMVPFMITDPSDKPVSKERIDSINQAKEELQRNTEQAEQERAKQRQRAPEQTEQQWIERRAAEQAEQQRIAQQRAAEQAEQQRLAQQRAAEQAEQQRIAQQRAAEQAEQQRIAQQRAAEQAEEQKLLSTPAEGWSYFGKIYESEWLTRNFDGGTDRFGAPKKGDTVTARTNVALRIGPIQLTLSGWRNQKSLDVINTGGTYKVKSVVIVKDYYYWIEVFKSE